MAIAFRSVGTRKKVDVTSGGSPQAIAMPSGHTSGDCLLLVCIQDAQTHETGPSGWNFLGRADVGVQTGSAYYPDASVYWKVDNGSEPSTVNVGFSTAGYPTGNPYVLAFIMAYSGTHATSPIAQWASSTTTATTAALDHPQITTLDANDWLLTIRAIAANAARTFTCSVGTDAERVDDVDTFGELAVAVYDSNTALAAGLQTVRTTTSSGVADWGSGLFSIALRPPAAAGATNAQAGVAGATGTAFDPSVTTTAPGWDACGVGMPLYNVAVDWTQDGSFATSGDDVTGDILSAGVDIEYGRDQGRQLSPSSMVGTMSFTLNDLDATYSPENTTSPLYGDLNPAREVRGQVVFAGQTFPLFRGRIDDYDAKSDQRNRSVSFTFLDNLALLQGVELSTPLYSALRTGQVINLILDAAGWTGPRDIDLGATFVPWWWAEGKNALVSIQEMVQSEGPPAIAYQSPDGTFVFRDRHHRLLRQASLMSQASFAAKALDCNSPAVTGLSYAQPFTYSSGWRDIVNSVSFEVQERAPDAFFSVVWSGDDTLSLGIGETKIIEASTSDPFREALTPVLGTDYTLSGAGTVSIALFRNSGQSVKIIIQAIGGSVTVTGLKLRAKSVSVKRTRKISSVDSVSIAEHGERSYPGSAPWANANDAQAIAELIVAHYSERSPIVQLRITSSDPAHWINVVQRTMSDRITIRNDELGLNDDFYVEHVKHAIQRLWSDRPPVHSIILGCEKQLTLPATNPFTFDKKGAGFDQGVFDPRSSDDPNQVFIFDHPVQGVFDSGHFGT